MSNAAERNSGHRQMASISRSRFSTGHIPTSNVRRRSLLRSIRAERNPYTKAALRNEIISIEKEITQLLDRIVDAESATVIGAYERKIDELERQKLVIAEKRARCGTAIKGYDESFRTAFEFLSSP